MSSLQLATPKQKRGVRQIRRTRRDLRCRNFQKRDLLKRGIRQRDSRGAALVETAIVLPMLVLIAFGTLEFGYLFMHASSVANASAVAARTGGATQKSVVSDSVIMEQVKSRKLALNNAQYVVIYKSTSADGWAAEDCLAGIQVSGACNVYKVGPEGSFTGDGQGWPAESRRPGEDFLGVAIVGKHDWLTGVFGKGFAIQDSGVVLIEDRAKENADPTVGNGLPPFELWGTAGNTSYNNHYGGGAPPPASGGGGL